MINKYLLQPYNIGNKFYARTYRLLAKHKQENSLNNGWLNYSILDIGKYEKKDAFNDKLSKEKNKKTNKCSLNNIKGYGQAREVKSSALTVGDKYFAKRMLDNTHFLNNIRGVTNANIKNLRKKRNDKYKVLFMLPGILILVGLSMTLIIYILNYFNVFSKWTQELTVIMVLFLILSMLVISLIAYVCKKIKKHEKSLRIISEIHDRDYLHFPNV
ncbi:Plasmodium exported protein (Pm-fam-a like), unknown function [Plasmodium malariae]|uniref:Uncharacterized protein n=1 Tax=Plasmodium malariae TaxID=5858 RepID=A0A1A8X0Y2_PLAMA|nr:Plasmodium exported protein (Pm-fam-a like), unknown function [Plasmodium malariae]